MSAFPSSPAPPPFDARRIEALTLAMAIAPGVYARNRMFEVFRHPDVSRARARASLLRGVVRQLGLATDLSLESQARGHETCHVLRYRIVSMRLSRVVDLTGNELSGLRVLAARAGLSVLPPDDADRTRVDAALAHLLDAGSLRGSVPGPASPRR